VFALAQHWGYEDWLDDASWPALIRHIGQRVGLRGVAFVTDEEEAALDQVRKREAADLHRVSVYYHLRHPVV